MLEVPVRYWGAGEAVADEVPDAMGLAYFTRTLACRTIAYKQYFG